MPHQVTYDVAANPIFSTLENVIRRLNIFFLGQHFFRLFGVGSRYNVVGDLMRSNLGGPPAIL